MEKKSTLSRVNELVKQAYTVVVTISEKNEVIAFKVVLRDNTPLFSVIKAEKQSRILESAMTPDALLPGGPYNLWHEGDAEYRVNDMEKAFAQFYRLPKMLNRKAIVETLLDGCRQGLFVLRSTRSDQSYKTFWYDAPDIASVKDLNLVVVLSEEATLATLPARLLSPGVLSGLWKSDMLRLKDVYDYFSGGTVVQGASEWDTLSIPKAEREVVNAAVCTAVKEKQLWLLSGQASMFAEEVPTDLLNDEATLQKPPVPLAVKEIMPDNLPEAWQGKTETTALEIANALSTKAGKMLPWALVRDVLTNAFNMRYVERTHGQWPCDYAGAHMVGVGQRTETVKQPPKQVGEPESSAPPLVIDRPGSFYAPSGVFTAAATLRADEIQDLNDQLAEIIKACREVTGTVPTFHLSIELHPKSSNTPNLEKINELLQEVSPQLKLT